MSVRERGPGYDVSDTQRGQQVVHPHQRLRILQRHAIEGAKDVLVDSGGAALAGLELAVPGGVQAGVRHLGEDRQMDGLERVLEGHRTSMTGCQGNVK